jgi:hypothetical protein
MKTLYKDDNSITFTNLGNGNATITTPTTKRVLPLTGALTKYERMHKAGWQTLPEVALTLIANQDVAGMTAFVARHDPDYPLSPDNLPLWVASIVAGEPFAADDTHRQALRDIRMNGLVGERAVQAAQAAL